MSLNVCHGEFLNDEELMNGTDIGNEENLESNSEYQYEEIGSPQINTSSSQSTLNVKENNLQSEKNGTPWLKTTINFNFGGSLKELSLQPLSKVQLQQAIASKVFGDHGSIKSKNQKDILKSGKGVNAPEAQANKIIVKNITLSSVKSTFECAIGMKINGIKGPSSTNFTTDGQTFDYIIYPNAEFQGQKIVLMDAPHHEDIPFLKVFPGVNEMNLTTGIVDMENEPFCLVQAGHPVLVMIDEANIKSGLPTIQSGKPRIANYYPVEKSSVKQVTEMLINDIKEGLPVCNINDISFSFTRAFTNPNASNNLIGSSWLDDNEIYDKVGGPLAASAEAKKAVQNRVYRVYGSVQIEYSLL